MVTMKVRIKFIEGILGTASNNKDIYSEFIASKAPDAISAEEEIAAIGVSEFVEKGTTVFPRKEDGTPFLYDYQIKGFFKDTCGMLNKLTVKDPETGKKGKAVNESSKITAFKKVIDGLIFVEPRKIPFQNYGDITICQRPLRAQTAQGERIALASSEEIPAGATIEFTVVCMSEEHVKAVMEWLGYGYYRGIGQWRNSSKGRFVYEILSDATGWPIAGNMDLAEEYIKGA